MLGDASVPVQMIGMWEPQHKMIQGIRGAPELVGTCVKASKAGLPWPCTMLCSSAPKSTSLSAVSGITSISAPVLLATCAVSTLLTTVQTTKKAPQSSLLPSKLSHATGSEPQC